MVEKIKIEKYWQISKGMKNVRNFTFFMPSLLSTYLIFVKKKKQLWLDMTWILFR